MTTSVRAWAVALPDRAKSDAPGRKGSPNDEGFDDAVKFGKAGRQARHASVADTAGEARRPSWNADVEGRGRLADEPIAGDTEVHRRWMAPAGLAGGAIEKAAKNRQEPSGEPAVPEEHAATGPEAPVMALRPPLPPAVLLGGYGRPEAGASDQVSSSAEPAAEEIDAEPSVRGQAQPEKPDAVPAKAGAHAVGAPATGFAKRDAAAGSAPDAVQTTLGGEARRSAATPTEVAAVMFGETAGKSPLAGRPIEAAAVTEAAKPGVAAASAALPQSDNLEGAVARDLPAQENGVDASSLAGRVVVLAQQNVPAPPVPPSALAAAPLLAAIAADGSWRELAAADQGGLPGQQAVASAHSLKVQLRPAELGMVTASLRFAGDQLTIELQVESAEAQQRLSADSDTIVKSLRALGLEVDRVTIQQSTVVQTSSTRSDANVGQNGQPAPDRQSFNASNSGGGNGQAGGQKSGRSTSNGAHESRNVVSGGADRTGGGLYI